MYKNHCLSIQQPHLTSPERGGIKKLIHTFTIKGYIKFFSFFLLFFYALGGNGFCQNPQHLFTSPLDIPITLSGTFAEMRVNHFHTGIDIRTNEKEGYNVYSPADGYVSRIKVSPFGFGNALYITHYNGLVTVYGHLSAYNQTITNYLRKEQYKKESFEVDLILPKNKIRIKKGEIIALTGNSGGSEGPHLHFEIRNERNEKPVNPFVFGFDIQDTIPPTIKELRIYNSPYFDERKSDFEVTNYSVINKNHNHFQLKTDDTIKVGKAFYLGILTTDKMNGTKSDFGNYSVKVYMDSTLYFKYSNNQLSFKEPRFVNCFIDYPEYYDNGKRFQITKKLPGNKWSNYDTILNNGIFTLNDNNSHLIKYVVTDFKGNTSTLSFYIKKDNTIEDAKKEFSENEYFYYNKINTFKNKDVTVSIPEGALYYNISFNYNSTNSEKYLSKVHTIHDNHVPLHISYALSLKVDSIADSLRNKLLIVRINGNNKVISEGGKWNDGFVKANVNNFGKFAVWLDTIPPKIKPLNIKDQKNITSQKTIEIKITDELSGIKNYKAFMNGKWILMEYNVKEDLLTYTIDDNVKEGSNYFHLYVEDAKENKADYETELIKYIY